MKARILLFIILFWIFSTSLEAQNKFLGFAKNNTENESTVPKRIVSDNGLKGVVIEYNFNGATASSIEIKGIKYDFLHIEDFAKMGQIGKPALPAHNDIIAIPQDAEISIEVVEIEFRDYDGYKIHPALKPALDTEGAPEPEFEIDENLYKTNKFFPEKIIGITEYQYLRELQLATLQIRPIQFNPKAGKIRVYSKIRYEIKFIGNNKTFDHIASRSSSNYMKTVKNIALNNKYLPEGLTNSIQDKSESSNANDRKDYIIITNAQYVAAADTLAKWKRQMGYTVEVVSRSSWTTSQVKDSIHLRYNNWTPHPDYFVIIGDHTGSYGVPAEIKKSPKNDDFVTDLYYACMGGANDYYPDIAHGRISVSSQTEAMSVIKKIIKYEKQPVVSNTFYSNGLNCAQYQDDNKNGIADRRFTHTSEDIRGYMVSKNYNVNRVYYSNSTPRRYNNGYYSDGQLIPAALRASTFNWNGGSSDILGNINAGKFYVFHRDHGFVGGSGWAHPRFTKTNISALTNGDKLPVVFSINCHTGEFSLTECFAEAFLRHTSGGAVGVFAASYYSLSGFNDGLSCGLVDAIWSNPGLVPNFGSGGFSNPTLSAHSDIYTMGDVLNQGLIRMRETWNGATSRFVYEHELFHYFGDPAMRIWTAKPKSAVVMTSDTIDCSLNYLNVYASKVSVPGATAVLTKDNEFIAKTKLNAQGQGTILFTPQPHGTILTLTITKHNYRPYIKKITVICLNSPPYPKFKASKTQPCPNEIITIADSSAPKATAWKWVVTPTKGVSFVNSTNSNSQNPQISFSSIGDYNIKLIATNSFGSDSIEKVNYIKVRSLQADFAANLDSVCVGTPVQFTDISSCNTNAWKWSFSPNTIKFVAGTDEKSQNPMVIFDSTGDYTVKFVATNTYGTDSITKTAFTNVRPFAILPLFEDMETFTYGASSGILGNGWEATSTSPDFKWYVDKAGTTSANTGPAKDHTKVTSSGMYIYTEASSPAKKGDQAFFTSSCLNISSLVEPTLSFWYHMYGKDIDTLSVELLRNGTWSSVHTIIGQQQTSNYAPWLQTVIDLKSYKSGLEKIRFRVVRGSSYAGDIAIDDINIKGIDPPIANFEADKYDVCSNDLVKFTNKSTKKPESWLWLINAGSGFVFANSTTDTSKNPEIRFVNPGIYNIRLNAINSAGTDTFSKYVNVHKLPDINLGKDTTIATDTSIILDAGNGFSKYLWSTKADTQIIKVDSSWGIGETHLIWAKVTDKNGCKNSDTIKITILQFSEIGEDILGSSIKIYPNPTNGIFTVEVENNYNDNLNMQILDNKGSILYQTDYNKQTHKQQIDMSNYAKGIYFIKFMQSDKIKINKIIKE